MVDTFSEYPFQLPLEWNRFVTPPTYITQNDVQRTQTVTAERAQNEHPDSSHTTTLGAHTAEIAPRIKACTIQLRSSRDVGQLTYQHWLTDRVLIARTAHQKTICVVVSACAKQQPLQRCARVPACPKARLDLPVPNFVRFLSQPAGLLFCFSFLARRLASRLAFVSVPKYYTLFRLSTRHGVLFVVALRVRSRTVRPRDCVCVCVSLPPLLISWPLSLSLSLSLWSQHLLGGQRYGEAAAAAAAAAAVRRKGLMGVGGWVGGGGLWGHIHTHTRTVAHPFWVGRVSRVGSLLETNW